MKENILADIKLSDIYVEIAHSNIEYLQLFAMLEGQVVGTVNVEAWGRKFLPFICRLWVADAFRREGIAEMLLKEIEHRARLNENTSLALYVHKTNVAARQLYEKLGFFAATVDTDGECLYAKQLNGNNNFCVVKK